jgi:DNA transformation protein and related proteins
MGELCKLVNIGDKLEAQLNEVGIETFDQLKKVGSKQAWLNIKAIDNSACINRLCALEGALQGVRWHSLSNEVKDELKDFFNTVK